ncbi:unnamed protein product [Rotaria socialis]|uniref:SAM dependent carboxyl methyltransferase n=1 Tax=Rotaria socialis TaxID=392032 RepID=A0A821BMP5_9BILA|nr:unnamed protein product [Rotaria socialis]CAF3204648.1 unnamed protein product [Rotaria socialis]CAF3576013.1 unnamed protein product [Rotaria socialis]CAF4224675.1 unnamed protein product [Rotaria socialis]CAF4491310.1 unnamed protein product [Rotaria socialis]
MSDTLVNVTGSYNTNSQPQLTAINLSISFIHQAIDALDIDNSFLSNPLIIADFGTSHGANSVYAMKLIINCLREKNKLHREPLIIHNDLPTNDWKKVFQLLIDDNSYQAVVSGHSFYEQCLPNNSLSIGHSSTSIHWLSKKPCNISNHCVSLFATGDELIAFQSQARMDYMNFLENRSRELIPGGILILTIPSLNDQGQCGNQNAKDLLYKCAEEIHLTTEELFNYTIPSHIRSYNECVDEELFNRYSFQLIRAELRNNLINFYEQLENGEITLDEFAQSRTEFMRPWCEPILKTALEMNEQHSKELVNQMLNQYWIIYQSKIKEKPDEYKSYLSYTYLILKKN